MINFKEKDPRFAHRYADSSHADQPFWPKFELHEHPYHLGQGYSEFEMSSIIRIENNGVYYLTWCIKVWVFEKEHKSREQEKLFRDFCAEVYNMQHIMECVNFGAPVRFAKDKNQQPEHERLKDLLNRYL